MPTLLRIDSSPMAGDSISRSLTQEFVDAWTSANPNGKVISRDLAATVIPVIDAVWIAANLTPKESRTPQQEGLLKFSTELTQELLDADEYVMGIPVHNSGPCSLFKLWVDQIVRFGETLIVTPSGPRGALGSKCATFVLSAGKPYRPGSPDAPRDLVKPWLCSFFGYLGISHLQFVIADGTASVKNGERDRSAFLAPHLAAIDALFCEAPSSARP